MSSTHKSIRLAIQQALKDGNVIRHDPTPQNPLGQSGAHTFADDIIKIVVESEEGRAYTNVMKFLLCSDLG